MANDRNTYRGVDPRASGAGGVCEDCMRVCGRAPPCRGIDVRAAGVFDPVHILLKEVSCPSNPFRYSSHWFQNRGELRLYRSRYSSARRDCIGYVAHFPPASLLVSTPLLCDRSHGVLVAVTACSVLR